MNKFAHQAQKIKKTQTLYCGYCLKPAKDEADRKYIQQFDICLSCEKLKGSL